MRFVAINLSALVLVVCAASAGAAMNDCVRDGGMAVCTAPILVPLSPTLTSDADSWTYALCEDQPPFARSTAIWCQVAGGSWVTSDPKGPYCVSAQPVLDPVVHPWSHAFEGMNFNACTTNDGPDSGWGATVNSTNCWIGQTTYKNGNVLKQFRDMNFFGTSGSTCGIAWSQKVYGRRERALACPQGYQSRQKLGGPAGDIECFYLPPCCESVGNPINPAQGNKTLVEVDFRSPRADGLSVVRYYNNAGLYKEDTSSPSVPPVASDFWRTTFDRRVVPMPGNTFAMASTQREDGSVQYFSPSGLQLHNIDGGANRLAKLVDAGGNTTGWKHTSASNDIELYDAAGALQSITYRSGMVHTLGYSNASTPTAIAPRPGLLIGINDSFGRGINFTYDAQGHRVSVSDPKGQLYVYAYDSKGNLSKVTYPDQTSRTYVYGEAANNCGGTHTGCSYMLMPWTLTGIVDENGGRFASYVYSGSGLAVDSEHAEGADGVSVAYALNSATITNALGGRRTIAYTPTAGVLKTGPVTQPCVSPGCTGTITRYTYYDTKGNVSSKTDFGGMTACYAYDLTRNLEIVRVEGAKWGVDACNVVLVTLPNRADVRKISTQWHAALGLPTKIAEPNRLTTNTYNGDGGVYCAPSNVIGVLCKRTLQQTADATGQQGLSATTTGMARMWQYTYDAFGQVLTATDPNNRVTTTTYYSANDPDREAR